MATRRRTPQRQSPEEPDAAPEPPRDRTPKKPEPHLVWVRNIGKIWVYYPEVILNVGIPLFTLLACIGGMAETGWLVWTGLYGLGGCFVLMPVYSFLFFRYLVCPKCGHNPTRRTDGKRKMHSRALRTIIARLEACPKCGDAGGRGAAGGSGDGREVS